MVYITGDTHGMFEGRFGKKTFPEQKNMTKDDYLIICGDFGGIWERIESGEEKYWLDWFDAAPFTLLFVDGNHENYDRLKTYPVKEWKGGLIHEIRPSVFHLMRGQVFEIDGKKIFTFGGARSHDISGGVLNLDDPDYKRKKKVVDKSGLSYRINHVSWWKEELPDETEMEEGLRNLEKHSYKVDFVITHCAPDSVVTKIDRCYEKDIETEYLEKVKNLTNYRKWIFGHYHDNMNIDEKHILIYEQIIRLW